MGDLGSPSETRNNSGTQSSVTNEQVGAADLGVALRGDGNTVAGAGAVAVTGANASVNVGVSEDFLERLAGGAGDVVERINANTADAVRALSAVNAPVGSAPVSGGSETGRVVLIGLAVGAGALALLKFSRK